MENVGCGQVSCFTDMKTKLNNRAQQDFDTLVLSVHDSYKKGVHGRSDKSSLSFIEVSLQ